MREPTEDNPKTDKLIGIAFDDQTFLSLMEAYDNRVLQIVAVPGSFFAYEPVLTCLQKVKELPFREELLLEDVGPLRPMYQGVDAIMGQLGEISCACSQLQSLSICLTFVLCASQVVS